MPYDAKKSDVFALGIILFIYYTGIPPFLEASGQDQYYVALCKNPKAFWKFHASQKRHPKFSPSFITLINQMLAYKEEDRLSIEQVMSSDWFKESFNEKAAVENIQMRIQQLQTIKFRNQEQLDEEFNFKSLSGRLLVSAETILGFKEAITNCIT